MDGRASLQEIATAYLLRYGSFDFEIIPTLIVKLLRADLLTMRPVSRLRAVLARNRRNPAARAMEGTLHALERLTVDEPAGARGLRAHVPLRRLPPLLAVDRAGAGPHGRPRRVERRRSGRTSAR